MYKSGNDNKTKKVISKSETYDTVGIHGNNGKIYWFITLMWGSGQVLDSEFLL